MKDAPLGTPVELPWWVIPLPVPPVLVGLSGIILAAPLWAHLLAVLSSLAILAVLARVATHVTSRNMQSVWISAVYAVWVFIVITWAVVVATTPTCHCT